jgi:TonB family protein
MVRGIGTVCVAVVCAAVLIGVSAATVRAQESQVDALAKQSAAALAKTGAHSVVVLDFTGTDAMAPLGERLAADFRGALARDGAAASLKVEDRAETVERVTERSLSLGNLRDSNTMRWVYGETSVDSWISGTLSDAAGGGVTLALQLHHLGNIALIAEFSGVIPLPADMKALTQAAPHDEFASMPQNGAEGFSKAACKKCREAVYSREAVAAKARGTVILTFTIDKHGNTKDVRVKQGLPDGLTQQAIDAVLEWKFTPAKNAKGKRVDVRQLSEISFNMM